MRKFYLGKDNPVFDKEHPAGLAGFSCPSEEGLLFGIIYYAEGLNNPTAILCHGFPGMEKNYDIAQNLRLAGFNTIVFSYRGAWGSRGCFTFSGVSEDTLNVLRHVERKKLPCPERIDAERVVLVGHSMGGFAAFRAAASASHIRDVALLAVWNIGIDANRMLSDDDVKKRVDDILNGVGCLSGTSRATLKNEMLEKGEDFDLLTKAPLFKGRRVLFVGAEEDSLTPLSSHQALLCKILRREKVHVSEKVLDCDHAFSTKRNAVSRILLKWLAEGGY